MQVTETLSDGLKRGYTVVVPAADIETLRAKRLAELGRDLRLPGFRPGKVPATLVRQRYGGAVTAEVLEQSVNDAARQVISDRNLRSAGQPKIEVTKIEEKSDLEFTVELEVLPDIAVPDLSGLTLTRLKAEPSAESIDRALGEIARRQRRAEPIEEDRPATTGDVLTIDFVGKIDGREFAGGSAQDVDAEVGGGQFIPGFSEQLDGMRPGEERTIEVTFPADYGSAELAGKHATFAVSAKALKRWTTPVMDDAMAEQMGFEGLDEVRKTLAGQMQREYDQLSRLRIKRELLDALAERAHFPAPESMVETEFAQIWQRIEADRKEGRLDADDAAKDETALQSEYRAIAERRVRLGLLLAEIGRANAITVSNDEMARAVRAEAGRYPGQEQQVLDFFRKNPQAAEGLRGPIFEEKVVDFVLELAQVTDRVVAPEALAIDAEPEQATPATQDAADHEPAQGAVPAATQAAATEPATSPDDTADGPSADPGQVAGVVA